MKHRLLAVAIVLAAIALPFFAQVLENVQATRYVQHMEAPALGDLTSQTTLDCIRPGNGKAGYYAGAVDTAALRTHLPLLEVQTGGQEIPGGAFWDASMVTGIGFTLAPNGEITIPATLAVRDRANALHSLSDTPTVTADIRIRIRGNSSRWFDKPSYSVKLVQDGGQNLDIGLLGMEAHHDWVLHGPFLDKTLMRNYMGMNLSGMLMRFAPDVRFCELVVNGEYRGVYVLMETVSKGKGRADVRAPVSSRGVTGYIMQFNYDYESVGKELDTFTGYAKVLKKNVCIALEYPGPSQITPALRRYVERDISRVEKVLYSYDYDDPAHGYSQFLDVGEFVDYFLVMELFEMHDTGNLSTFFYRDVTGKIRPAPWDFNNGADNYSVLAEDDFGVRQFVGVQAPWFINMLKDEAYVNALIARWRQLRQSVLSDESLSSFIYGTAAYLGEAVDRNYAVWGYSFNPANFEDFRFKLRPDDRNPRSYAASLTQLETALLSRANWLDANIEALRQYCHESAVKKLNP